ncbi:MAG: sialidase family protein, partial [Bacteroidota bacterium]
MNRILLGTQKGLVIFARGEKEWYCERSLFVGLPVTMVYPDPRNGHWWVGIAHRHWGQKLHRSTDQGQNWEEIKVPRYPKGAEIRPGKAASLRQIWVMQHGGLDRPNRLYMGTEPGGLFVSENNGDDWQLVQSLWDHPSRPEHWFGTGTDYPEIHSIVLDPRYSDHIYVAVSCAGVFETKDGGQSWHPRNKGLIAAYLPNPNVEVGHDPHRLLLCPSHPSIMWQQNHCGVFRSVDAGQNWQLISEEGSLVDYGFALAVDPNDPERAWVIPAQSDAMRVAPDLGLYVATTQDGGQNWRALREGLPQQHAFDLVFRHAFDLRAGTLA